MSSKVGNCPSLANKSLRSPIMGNISAEAKNAVDGISPRHHMVPHPAICLTTQLFWLAWQPARCSIQRFGASSQKVTGIVGGAAGYADWPCAQPGT